MASPIDNPIAKEFYSLFENARVLAVRHHRRKFAEDVLMATKVYLTSKRIDYDGALFQDLVNSLKDKHMVALNDKFDLVFGDVISKIVALGARKNVRRPTLRK